MWTSTNLKGIFLLQQSITINNRQKVPILAVYVAVVGILYYVVIENLEKTFSYGEGSIVVQGSSIALALLIHQSKHTKVLQL
jgi:hypothetical protein